MNTVETKEEIIALSWVTVLFVDPGWTTCNHTESSGYLVGGGDLNGPSRGRWGTDPVNQIWASARWHV